MGRKKKVKPGMIELHPDEAMIIVHYEMQYVDIDEDGNSHITEKQHLCIRIKIKSFNPNSNHTKIAKEVIEHCKYIHPSKQDYIADERIRH